jgi:putative tryptophan/tyrosine transport system substrate-binding protein
MRRRDLLGGVASVAALAPFAAAAQPAVPIIGYLSNRSPEAETSLRGPFLEALEKAGFVVGRNVAIEYRFAAGQIDRVPSLAADLVRLPVTVLVATGHGEAVTAKQATATIPIVFGTGSDPVQTGLVASLGRPGGNATGMHVFVTGLIPKRLELLHEVLPQPGLIAALFGPTLTSNQPQISDVETAARALGRPLLVLHARNDDEVETAFSTMAERQANGLVYGASTYFQVIADKLVALAARYRIPAVYEWPEFVAAGGLMSYSTDRREIGQRLGDYVGRSLKGASPADLPVMQSSRFQLTINLKTAKALGLTVPHVLLQRADEVIE